MKRIAIIALSMVWLGAATSLAADSRFKEILAHVPRAELRAKAAGLITELKVREREAVTPDVVKSALALSPATAPIIVSAIARALPEMAAIAAEQTQTGCGYRQNCRGGRAEQSRQGCRGGLPCCAKRLSKYCSSGRLGRACIRYRNLECGRDGLARFETQHRTRAGRLAREHAFGRESSGSGDSIAGPHSFKPSRFDACAIGARANLWAAFHSVIWHPDERAAHDQRKRPAPARVGVQQITPSLDDGYSGATA